MRLEGAEGVRGNYASRWVSFPVLRLGVIPVISILVWRLGLEG